MKQYFINLIRDSTQQSSRHLTVETINRYIYTLNAVHKHGHISEVELRKLIKSDLERSKSFEMDKKTLKRIVENLRKEGLVQTKNFKVTIYQAGESADSDFSEDEALGAD